jgi:hypothetical protein
MRTWLASLAAAIIVGTAAIGTGLASGIPAASGAAAAAHVPPAGHWGGARDVRGGVAKSAGASAVAEVQAVSCTEAGNCGGGGSVTDAAGLSQGVVLSEHGGTWGAALPATTPQLATSSMVGTVSCGRTGSCMAGGSFIADGPFSHALLVSEANGRWSAGREVPGLDAINHGSDEVDSVSCAAAGNCLAAGGYVDASGNSQVFVAQEKGGKWGDAQLLPGLAFLNTRGLAFARSASCAAPGDCVVVGSYLGNGGFTQAYEAEESGGTWTGAQPVNGVPSLNTGNSHATAVSCAAPGDCAVAGTYTATLPDSSRREQAFVADEAGGTWQLAQPAPGVPAFNARNAAVTALSCRAPGDCALAGFADDNGGQHAAFVDDEAGGAWRQAQVIGGSGTIQAWIATEAHTVSCGSPGNCVAGGFSVDPGGVQRAFAVAETHGAWGKAIELPGTAARNAGGVADVASVSCAAPGDCAAGGFYTAGGGIRHAVTADRSAVTATSLALSARRARFGRERAERLSVKVTPRTGGTPGGRVTVKAGSRTICVIKLKNGKGGCTLAAKQLRPGGYRLTAGYGGDATYAGSASAAKNLKITR